MADAGIGRCGDLVDDPAGHEHFLQEVWRGKAVHHYGGADQERALDHIVEDDFIPCIGERISSRQDGFHDIGGRKLRLEKFLDDLYLPTRVVVCHGR